MWCRHFFEVFMKRIIFMTLFMVSLGLIGADAKPKAERIPLCFYDQLGACRGGACRGGGSDGSDGTTTTEVYEHGSVTTYVDGTHRIAKIVIELRR
jgi:hypothetical protein